MWGTIVVGSCDKDSKDERPLNKVVVKWGVPVAYFKNTV